MARVKVPLIVGDLFGNVVGGASVALTKKSDGSVATWWTARTGGTSSTAAVVSDGTGRVPAWVDNGSYGAAITPPVGTTMLPYTEEFEAPSGDSLTVIKEAPLNLGLPPYSDLQSGDDWGPVLQAGLMATDSANTAHLLLPKGSLKILSAVTKNFAPLGGSRATSVKLSGQGSGTRLWIDVDDTAYAIDISNLGSLILDDMMIRGTVGSYIDAKRVLNLTACKTTIGNVGFYGLMCAVTGGAVIHSDSGDLRLSAEAEFRGCSGSSGLAVPVVKNVNWRSFICDGAKFIDYGYFDGVEVSKTPLYSAVAWIEVGQPGPGLTALDQIFHISRGRFDEGAIYAVWVHGDAVPIRHAVLENIRITASAGDGAAMWLAGINEVTVRDYWCGDLDDIGSIRDGLHFVNCKKINLEEVDCAQKYTRIFTSGAEVITRRNVSCAGGLVKDAATVVHDGVAPALIDVAGNLAAISGTTYRAPDGKLWRESVDNAGARVITLVTLADDAFAGTAGTLLSAHTEPAAGAVWTVQPGHGDSIVITDANAIRTSAGGAHMAYYAPGVPISADYEVEGVFVVKSLAGYPAIAGRMSTSVNTRYSISYDAVAGQWGLYSVVADNAQLMGSYSQTLVVGQSVTVKLQMRGTAIKVYIDGVQVISVVNSAVTAAGRAGVRFANFAMTNTTGIHIDKLTAAQL